MCALSNRNPGWGAVGALLLSIATLAFAPRGIAQPEGAEAPPDDAAARESEPQLPPTDMPGLAPQASFSVSDEITVRGQRPGEIRGLLWDLDTEIESTIVSFYRMLNDVVIDEQFHVDCVWGPTQLAPGVVSQIRQRFCYAGYQQEELRAKRDLEAAGGVYEPDQVWLAQKEEEYAERVIAAMAAHPALVVAAEDLLAMQEERLRLTGGDPSLSLAQLDRQRARDSVRAPFERRAERQTRKERREAEQGAERLAEQQAEQQAAEPR
jgi:hypothetical protein